MSFTEELKKALDAAEKTVAVTIEQSRTSETKASIQIDDGIEDPCVFDTEGWTLEQLQAKLEELEGKLEEIEDCPPDESDEAAYGEWEDQCERLEEAIGVLEDRIEELEDAEA